MPKAEAYACDGRHHCLDSPTINDKETTDDTNPVLPGGAVTIITSDGRPEYQFAAVMAWIYRDYPGVNPYTDWLPTEPVTADEVERAIALADETSKDWWVGWNEHGAIVAEPRQ